MRAVQHASIITALNTFVTACPKQECSAIDHLGFVKAIALGTDQQVKAQYH